MNFKIGNLYMNKRGDVRILVEIREEHFIFYHIELEVTRIHLINNILNGYPPYELVHEC